MKKIKLTKTRSEIAEEYGIDRRTLQRWLKKEKVAIPNRMLTPREQQLIYQLFGKPESLDTRGRNVFGSSRWR